MLGIKRKILTLINPKGKTSFIDRIVKNCKVLDVGCGNNSPILFKTMRPDVYYTGIDIGIYNQKAGYNDYADELIITNSDDFRSKIEEYTCEFDSIICAHNLEHCDDHMGVTSAMIKALKNGGTIYISFPCEESVRFPKRTGCLNFYDDPTHKNLIEYSSYIDFLNESGLEILFTRKRYRPVLPYLIGLLFEPYGRAFNKQAPFHGTWALYGFETIIIAQKQT